jgi:hypothetical protein
LLPIDKPKPPPKFTRSQKEFVFAFGKHPPVGTVGEKQNCTYGGVAEDDGGDGVVVDFGLSEACWVAKDPV